MSDATPMIELTLAVPFEHPDELHAALKRAGSEYRLGERGLRMPDGRSIEVSVRPQDGEFAQVVCGGGGPHQPSDQERRAMEEAPTLLTLMSRGGSQEAAMSMLEAGAALMEVGASGVLVRNSGMGHGAEDWLSLAGDPTGGGVHWAYVTSQRASDPDRGGMFDFGFPAMFSIGMHCLGLRDVVVPTTGDDQVDWFQLNNYCGYLERSGRTPVNGDVLTALTGDPEEGGEMVPMFRVRTRDCEHLGPDHPMHNPYGLYVLEPLDPDDPESMKYRPGG